jgi:hypothetical protein
LTAAQEWFIKRATALEAQQVPLYCILANKAHQTGKLHLEVGLRKALEVEACHLADLKVAGERFGIALAFWEQLGEKLGRLSGSSLSVFDPAAWLKTINKIETLAASEYASARADVEDRTLQKLYMGNQVDEEYHRAWALQMLETLGSAQDGRASEPTE